MKKLYNQFRISEKIAISFGLVGFLFIGVIWQYHQTLQRSLSDYRELQEVYAAKKNHSLLINGYMLETLGAQNDFLLHRENVYVTAVAEALNKLLTQTDSLSHMDSQGAETGKRITELVQSYQISFDAVVEASRIKGLDHNSGLQGAFRDTVHKMEAKADGFKVDTLYLQLLQIRRGEKDLGLRRDSQYRAKVLGLIGGFEAKVQTSNLGDLKVKLLEELSVYRESFLNYAKIVLANKNIKGGKGPFRQSAHRIEALLVSYYVPDLGENILQLRRREKDYLLRGDLQYVEMALKELKQIHDQLNNSSIADTDKKELETLLNSYRHDFLELVEHNKKIDKLLIEMRKANTEVTHLVRNNISEADRIMQETTERIHSSSTADANLIFWVAAFATLLGIMSAVIITLSITRPLRHMAGILCQLAYEDPIERLPTVLVGRDEVNIMAQSINTIADHRDHFLNWWITSMREVEAYERASTQRDSTIASENLKKAQEAKLTLVRELQEKIQTLLVNVTNRTERLKNKGKPYGRISEEDAIEIEKAAKSALVILDVMKGSDR